MIAAGTVILYNPEDLTITNIESYIHYVHKLYVIDNSILYNDKVVDFCKSNKTVMYINNKANIGISKALNLAAKLAISEGYEWLLTMDQDSSIESGFFSLANAPLGDKKNIIISASYNNIYFRPKASCYNDFIQTETVITSGSLLNLNGWNYLGGFNEKLFIDEVDNEFCARAINKGYKIQSTRNVFLKHNLGTSYKKKNMFTGRVLDFTMHSPIRVYYMTRNNLDLWKRFVFTNPVLVYNRMKNLTKLCFEITFYYPYKFSYYKNIVKGIFHFLISKYEK